jgi:H+-transporting ATPase
MLEAAIALQLGLGVYVEAAVIAALLLFNATLGFVQEGRATAALAALKKRLAPTALVRRDGAWVRLPAAEVVPGDAIRLPLGSLVSADATIVSGSVQVDQSMLTGESVPVEAGPGDQVYAGSLVRRGQAVAEVTATGARTYFGRAAELVRTARAASTEHAAIFSVTRNLAVVNGIIAVSIVAYAYVITLPTADLLRLALTALLATIPVALPATFTLSAALAAQVLARRGVLLTRLSAAHEAAAMDLLCTDKTGTLTRNTLQVADVVPMPGFDRTASWPLRPRPAQGRTRTRSTPPFVRPPVHQKWQRRDGWCASFRSIRRPGRPRRSPSMARAATCASSRALSKRSPEWQRCRRCRGP